MKHRALQAAVINVPRITHGTTVSVRQIQKHIPVRPNRNLMKRFTTQRAVMYRPGLEVRGVRLMMERQSTILLQIQVVVVISATQITLGTVQVV